MYQKIDIAENELLKKYPDVLNILLLDRTTNSNIFWATDNYKDLGGGYSFFSQITVASITGKNNMIITPRVLKNKEIQDFRIKNMAEVFTPSWICNEQNNQIDSVWFHKKNVFNQQKDKHEEGLQWKTVFKKIVFPNGKTWEDYVNEKRLEIACGEAPYITSRYDATTGEYIPVQERIGILDRKLRIINENISTPKEWLIAVQNAYKSTYAYEWQGDSLLLAREAMLYTFIENYVLKFGKKPSISSIKSIAGIVSWNVWQMDGLTGTIPKNDEIFCVIKDWSINGKKDREIKFIDILK
jgi:hypothetical protein